MDMYYMDLVVDDQVENFPSYEDKNFNYPFQKRTNVLG